jgi:hypothetical protein
MRPPPAAFSRLRARVRVGGDFFERVGAARDDLPAPPGLVDRLDALAHPGVDVAQVHPSVAAFFLAPATLRLRVQSTWHGPFALLWRWMRPVLGAVGQFYLPRDRAVIDARTLALDPARDGRPDARGVLRSYLDRRVMQVVAYATLRAGGAGYMSTAFPLPFGALCGVLRRDPLGGEHGGALGARLTSRRVRVDEPTGIWFAPLVGPAFPLPLEETIDLWPAAAAAAPEALRAGAAPGDTLVGRHVQRLSGARFATHAYWFAPRLPLR